MQPRTSRRGRGAAAAASLADATRNSGPAAIAAAVATAIDAAGFTALADVTRERLSPDATAPKVFSCEVSEESLLTEEAISSDISVLHITVVRLD